MLLCFLGAGCTQNEECERDRACDVEAGTCVDPCKGACGQKSFCNAKEHKPSCFELANTESKFKAVVLKLTLDHSILNFFIIRPSKYFSLNPAVNKLSGALLYVIYHLPVSLFLSLYLFYSCYLVIYPFVYLRFILHP